MSSSQGHNAEHFMSWGNGRACDVSGDFCFKWMRSCFWKIFCSAKKCCMCTEQEGIQRSRSQKWEVFLNILNRTFSGRVKVTSSLAHCAKPHDPVPWTAGGHCRIDGSMAQHCFIFILEWYFWGWRYGYWKTRRQGLGITFLKHFKAT